MRPVIVRTREDDPDHAGAVRVGGRFEQHVDRGPRELDPFVHGEREGAALDEQVIVGRRDVDVSWLDLHLVLGIEHGTFDLRAQQLREAALLRIGVAMLGDRDRDVDVRG